MFDKVHINDQHLSFSWILKIVNVHISGIFVFQIFKSGWLLCIWHVSLLIYDK